MFIRLECHDSGKWISQNGHRIIGNRPMFQSMFHAVGVNVQLIQG